MIKHTLISVSIVVAISIFIGFLMSSNMDTRVLDRGLPWQIKILPDGSSQVFEINLGKTTLGEASSKFKQLPEYTMFVIDGQTPIIEAYYNSVMISGIKAKMVMGFQFSKDELEGIYNRGTRISTMGSGTRKVTMHSDDLAKIKQQAIISITYIPSMNLDAALIEKRFGKSSQRIKESDETEHWLYPQKGLDIVLNTQAKEVLQYVLPINFAAISEPLKQLQK